jgi:hypothetical protein
MRKRILFALIMIGIFVLVGGLLLNGRNTTAAPTVLAGSLEGGCYLETPTVCKIHVDPFTIDIAPGESLLGFQITANGQTLYDFGASINFSPVISYTPSSVALDFAASCGETYTLELHALDTSDLDFVTIGGTQPILCPSAHYETFIPNIMR